MNKIVAGLLAIVVFVGVSAMSIGMSGPPAIVPASAPAEEFSAERAMAHLNVIAKEAHPLGSEEHDRVRAYIESELKKAGLEPQVQNAVGVTTRWYNTAGSVQNVIARWKGTAGGGKAVAVVSHYDSVPAAPGAGDDGAAAAAMLETLRALKAGEKLKNDVIFLFTDGEEAGLLGASAFTAEHPWAKQIGVVLNFEGRGIAGPSLMFETSAGNEWLVAAFARTPHPRGSSLAYEIYKRMPNDTDLTVFKKYGAPGMNFAFVEGWHAYHTPHDSPAKLDPRSLQHHGSYMLALARQFGNTDLAEAHGASNTVFFNLLGDTLARYSTGFGIALAILIAVRVGWVMRKEVRNQRTSWPAVTWGAGIFVLSVLLTWGAGTLLRLQAEWLHGSLLKEGDVARSGMYLLSLVLIAAAIATGMYSLWRNKLSLRGLALGGLLVWTIAALLTAVTVPGASFLFAWTLLGSIVSLGALCEKAGDEQKLTVVQAMLLIVGALPAALLLSPSILAFFTTLGLTPMGTPVLAILLGMSLWLLLPQIETVTRTHRWAVPVAALAAGFALFIAGAAVTRYTGEHPKPDLIVYGRNADTGKAVWFSSGDEPDEWTEQFLTAKPAKGPLPDFFPDAPGTAYLKNDAPNVSLAGADVLLGDEKKDRDARTLTLQVMSPRRAKWVMLYVPEAEVLSASVNGKPMERDPDARRSPGRGWRLRYSNIPELGIEVVLKVRGTQPVKIHVVEGSPGLPAVPKFEVKARPDWLMPIQSGDVTLVSRAFTF